MAVGLLAGAAMIAGLFLAVWKIARGIISTRRTVGEIEAIGGSGAVVEVPSDELFAYCIGWRRPKIVVSSALRTALDPQARQAVIDHERHHLAHRHPAKRFALDVAVLALFWLPGFRGLAARLQTRWEVAADEAAIASAGDPASVGRALLTFASLKRGGTAAMSVLAAFVSGMETRIRNILRGGRAPAAGVFRSASGGWFMGSGMIAVAFLLVPISVRACEHPIRCLVDASGARTAFPAETASDGSAAPPWSDCAAASPGTVHSPN